MPKRRIVSGDGGSYSRSAKERRTEGETATTNVNPTAKIHQQLNNAIHGNIFHVKLLMLFLIRAICAKCEFKLGYEMPVLAGKFDDIIFKYKNKDGEERCSYLQAKHKLDENKVIEPDDLIDAQNKKKSDEFKLDKYLRSYCRSLLPRVVNRPLPDLDNLIICTNIEFDKFKLRSNGIELKPLVISVENPTFKNILSFKSQLEGQMFQLQNTTGLKENLTKYSDIVSLADVLIQRISVSKGGKVKLNTNSHELFQMYHWALVEENVIDKKEAIGKFHLDFVNGNSISPNALKLRNIIDKKLKGWHKTEFIFEAHFGESHPDSITNLHDSITDNRIDDFLEKLVFVVNAPNEKELNPILKSELGKYYNLMDTDLQSYAFLKKVLNLFMKPNKEDPWITPEKGQEILQNISQKVDSIRVYAISDDYKQTLKQTTFSFNDDAIKEMAGHLKEFLKDAKMGHIISDWPTATAVKVISALETLQEYKRGDSYVMVSLEKLKVKGQEERIHNALSKKTSHNNLLVVVCENETRIKEADYQIFFGGGDRNSTKIIVICTRSDNIKQSDRQLDISITDGIQYGQLHPDSQTDLLSKAVMFQGKSADNNSMVQDLVGENNKPNEVIDLASLKQLYKLKEKEVIIPAFNSSSLDSSRYIERRIKPLNDRVNVDKLLYELTQEVKYKGRIEPKREIQLTNELKLSNEFNIEWSPHLSDDRKSKIWTEIKNLLPKCLNDSQTGTIACISENDLAREGWKSKVVILSGLPGSGKSTILFSLYGKIKKFNPLCLVVRINFTDYAEALTNWEITSEVLSKWDKSSCEVVVEFFIRHLPAIEKNPFARSLIRHRLRTSGGIVLMMDGFDEIDAKHQDKAIHFMKEILQTKINRLYVTTRPHLNDKLQNGFFQFNYVYTLEHFSEKVQIDYLCKCWAYSNELLETIRFFAELLVKKVAENLKDKEKTLVGIPLQCKILAECFAQRIEKILHNGADRLAVKQQLEDSIKSNKLDLLGLYKQLMDTKEQIFREKQATKLGNFSTDNVFAKLLLRLMNEYNTKLAIRNIVSDSSVLDSLWPPSSSLESKFEKESKKRDLENGALTFGLTFNNSNEENRNQLEFIHRTFAEYLVAKYFYNGLLLNDANELLQNDRNLQFFVESILVLDEYDGVRSFLDSMLRDIDEREEWRDMVKQKSLPQRFQKIACRLGNRTKEFETVHGTEKKYTIAPLILRTAVKGKYSNIFEFITDCLDATQAQSTVRSIICPVFIRGYVTPSYADQSRRVIERFLESYEGNEPTRDHIKHVIESLPPRYSITGSYSFSDKSISFSYWNQKDTKAKVKLGLDFLWEHRNLLSQIVDSFFIRDFQDSLLETFYFFFINAYYDSDYMNTFLKIMTKVFNDQSLNGVFEKFFKKYYFAREKYSTSGLNERIKNLFTILQEEERLNVLKGISRLVLMLEPQTFKEKYLVDFVIADEDLLSKPNLFGLTRLHQVVFNGNSSIALFNTIPTRTLEDIFISKKTDSLSPLYVAAACGNKYAFREILSFLKEELTAHKLIEHFTYNRPDAILFRALLDAIEYEKIDMFKLILSAVKAILGQDGLLAILQPIRIDDNVNMESNGNIVERNMISNELDYSDVLIATCLKKEFMKTMANILDNGYEKLNEFLLNKNYKYFGFHETFPIDDFEDEILLGMFQAKGFTSWLKLYLDLNLDFAFVDIAQERFLNLLKDNEYVSEFFQILTCFNTEEGTEGEERMSYWAKSFYYGEWFDNEEIYHENLDRLLNFFHAELGQERLKELVTHRQCELITKILMNERKGVFEAMLKYLSKVNRKEICVRIFDNFSKTPLRTNSQFICNTLWFLAENDIKTNVVDVTNLILTTFNCEDGTRRSIWSLVIDSLAVKDEDEDSEFYTLFEDFLDFVTVKLGKRDEIKHLVLHDDGTGGILFKAMKERKKPHVLRILLKYSNDADRKEVRNMLRDQYSYQWYCSDEDD